MTDHADKVSHSSLLSTWWTACRVFSLPASITPVLFGTILAVTMGNADIRWGLFLLAVLAMTILHAGSNMINDVYDYKKGIDTEPQPGSGAVVRGLMTPRAALAGAVVCFSTGSILGCVIAVFAGWPILLIGGIGVATGVLYTTGPFPLKYHALGDLAVFVSFGVLGVVGAWMVQTETFSWIPVAWSVPIATFVPAILHANNWRDMRTDSEKKIKTVAALLGDRFSAWYYRALIFSPFVVLVALVAAARAASLTPEAPLWVLLALLSFPLALTLSKQAEARHDATRSAIFSALDAHTAQLNLLFGILLMAGLLVEAFF